MIIFNYNNKTINKMANERKSSGMGIGMILFLIFLVLKLTDNIDWSWWWVTAPLWIGLALGTVVLLILAIVAIIKK